MIISFLVRQRPAAGIQAIIFEVPPIIIMIGHRSLKQMCSPPPLSLNWGLLKFAAFNGRHYFNAVTAVLYFIKVPLLPMSLCPHTLLDWVA